jgi:hypothetical protein
VTRHAWARWLAALAAARLAGAAPLAAEATPAPAAVTAPAAGLDEPEPREETILFRWYDAAGVAHETTDPQTIPPGVKVRIAGPEKAPIDPKKTRRWWRARLSRLQASLHAAQDVRGGAEKRLAEAVKAGIPVADRDAYRKSVAKAAKAEIDAQAALDGFFAEAKSKKIPERWLH